MANEVNKQPNAVTRPPVTAVNRVDFRRQMPTMIGHKIFDTAIEKEVNQSENKKKYMNVGIFLEISPENETPW